MNAHGDADGTYILKTNTDETNALNMNTEDVLRSDQQMGVSENEQRCGEDSVDDIKHLHAHGNKDLSDFKNNEATETTDITDTEVKIEIDMPVADVESEQMEPFICGICYDTFANFMFYISHLKSHKSLDRFLHNGCKSKGLANTMCYTCHKCSTSFPSLCLLETHLLETENTSSFVINGRTKMAYIPKVDCFKFWEEILELENISTSEMRDKVDHEPNPKATHITEENVSHAKRKLRKRGPNKTAVKVTEKPNSSEEQENAKPDNSNSFNEKWETVDQDSDNETVDLDYDYKNVKESKKKVKSRTKKGKSKADAVKLSVDISNENDQVVEENEVESKVKQKRKYVSQIRVKKVKPDPNEKVPCSTCGALVIRRYLNCHVKKHEVKTSVKIRDKPYLKDTILPCEICGKNLKRSSMDKHILCHYPPKLKCDICGLPCRTKSNIKWHKQHVHAKESQYTCDKCGKAFKGPHYLKQHSHTHKAVPDILCPFCPKKFNIRQSLRAHLLSHTEKRPFSCDVCGKGFKSKARAKEHRNVVHCDETPHTCSFCGKGFKCKKDIYKHEKIHKPPENFCPVCKKGFIQKSNMRIHMKSQHPKYLEQNPKQCSDLEQGQGQSNVVEQNEGDNNYLEQVQRQTNYLEQNEGQNNSLEQNQGLNNCLEQNQGQINYLDTSQRLTTML